MPQAKRLFTRPGLLWGPKDVIIATKGEPRPMNAQKSFGPGQLSLVRYDFDGPLTPGRLIRRYKRFLADVELENGETALAHCPNSGSMLTCLGDMAPVMLTPSKNPKRRTAYTWEMIYLNGGWVGINTLVPNKLMVKAAGLCAHPLFAGAVKVRPEVKVSEHSRLDLVCELKDGGSLFCEVKNVTLMQDGLARFPDARTQRGAKHLGELISLKKKGHRAAMLYVVQRGDTRAFEPADDIDPDYAAGFHLAREAGVEMLVLEAEVSPQGIFLSRELPLNL